MRTNPAIAFPPLAVLSTPQLRNRILNLVCSLCFWGTTGVIHAGDLPTGLAEDTSVGLALTAQESEDYGLSNLEVAESLYRELLAMRSNPEFHKFGFSQEGPFRQWFEEFNTLNEAAKSDLELISKGIAVGDLYTMALEWIGSKGKETETTAVLSESWNAVYGEVSVATDVAEKTEPPKVSVFVSRTWTSADGTKQFVGEFREFKGGEVTIMKGDQPITFSIDLLSREDQEWLGQNIKFETVDGKLYEGVSVYRIEVDKLLVSSSKGIFSIPFEKLPIRMQEHFGFDQEKVDQLRREQAASAALNRAKQRQQEASNLAQKRLDLYLQMLAESGVDSSIVTRAEVEGETLTLVVTGGWTLQPKQSRQLAAESLWKLWAVMYSPNDMDKARLKLVDEYGRAMGGSRVLAGSLIWVKD